MGALPHNGRMTRPCFLVVDREYSGSLSTRKLLLEAAKLNVITSYSAEEALATLKKFPAVDGVVLDTGVADLDCTELVQEMRRLAPGIPVLAIGSTRGTPCLEADQFLEFYDPKGLLDYVRRLLPEQTADLERRERSL